MSVTVRIPSPLRKFTENEVAIQATGRTIGELVDSLEAAYPGIKERLVDKTGKLLRFVNFYVNDEDIRFLEGIATPVQGGDTVTIVPAVAGGRCPASRATGRPAVVRAVAEAGPGSSPP